ncbi:MAG: T9SS type A sorting domain-containing protein [Bacteroidia bacterium]
MIKTITLGIRVFCISVLLLLTFNGFAQPLTGTRTICTSGCDFNSIGAAVNALNLNGVGTGGVTMNVLAGFTEVLSSPIIMTATGTSTNPIIFQKSGTGANPLITAYAGIKTAASTDSIDVMWSFVGSDFITINGIDLQENSANTTPTTMMEVGYGFYKASATDGCNNNTIQNCTITLNRENFTVAATGVRQNAAGSVAIEIINALRTATSTALTITAISGASSNNRIYSNTIQNCHFGILLSGFAASSPYTLADLNNEIGGATPSTGNTIINFGGGTGSTNACGAILINNQWSFNITHNIINNNTGSGFNHGGSNRGIWLFNSSAGASCNVKHNRISIAAGNNTGAITWCLNVEMAQTGSGNTLNLDSNTFINCTNTSASTVAFTAIWLNTAATNVNVRGNYIYGYQYSGTGTSQCILSQFACGNLNISNNIIDSVILDGANATGTHHNIGVTTAPSVSLNINNNLVRRTILNTIGTGTKTLYGIYYTGSTPVNNFIGNIVDSISRNGTTGGTTIGIYQAGGTNGTSTTIVRRNIVSNLSISGTGSTSTLYGIQVSTGTIIVDSNTIFNLSCIKTTGSSALYGIYDISSPNNEAYNNNTIYNLFHNGTGVNYALYAFTTTGVRQVNNNIIYNIIGNSTTIGILMSSSSPTILRNKIYNIRTNGTTAIAVGIRITSVGTSGVSNLAYNLIDSILAPLCNNTTDGVRGIDLTTTTTTSNTNIYYNTIRLNANSTGTNFSSSGLFFTANTTATTANLTLRNNIIINTSTANGSGTTVAFRFSTNTTANYNAASNNNLYFAGSPNTNNLLYFDGTNRDSTLTQLRFRLAPRDAASITENLTFQTLVPDSFRYLMPSTTVLTQAESGGTPISGFTGDYYNLNNRATFPRTGQLNGGGTAPDLGAHEFDGMPADLTPPTINFTAITNTASTANRILINFATITDGSGVDTALATRPRLYYKKSTENNDITGWKFAVATNNSSPFSFVIDYSVLSGGSVSAGDTIQYFVVAQDRASIPNVGILSGTFASQPASVNLVATAFPITGFINRFIIATPLPTNITVGVGGMFSSFTGNGGLFEAINNNVLAGNTTVTVISDIAEPGIHALNGNSFGGYNLTILPNSTTERIINGAVATPGLFRFNGVRGLKIDGGSTKALKFGNNSTTGPVFHFLNDCVADTINNVQILGNNTSTGNILIGQSTGTTGNDSLVISNCYFRDTVSVPTTHINSTGSGSALNSHNRIINNEFVNFSANAINVTATGNGDNWFIYGNTNYQTAPRTTAISCILVSAGNGHIIRANHIGGAAPNRSGVPFTNTSSYIRGIDVGGNTNAAILIDSNQFSNIVTTASAGVFGVYINSGNVIVNANTFGGNANTWDTIQNGYDNGIVAVLGGTNITITNNLIGNVRYIKSGGDRTSGIFVSAAVPNLNISRNIIRDINHSGTGTATSTFRPCGILISGGVTNSSITDNTIFNINSTNTGTSAYVVSGIFITSTAFANNTIARNRIYNIGTLGTGTGTTAPTAYGIQITSQGAGNRYLNNQIMLGNTTAGQTFVSGIRDESTSAEALYINNSILINGVMPGGTNNSYCMQRTSTSNMILRNNILYNNRRTLGSGFNYAVGASSVIGISVNTLRKNLLVVVDTARVSEYPTGIGYGAFAYNNTLFAPSYNPEWIERAANLNAAELFIDTINGNLGIDTTKPTCWYANGKGMPLAGFSGDFNNVSGVRSTSVITGPVDIGSVEFNTTTIPPAAIADKAPATNDSTQYFFANRMVAKIVWGSTGVVPFSSNVRYYSGSLPANTPTGSSRAYSYWNIENLGAFGLNSTLTLMYDSSMLGNIANAGRTQIARYMGSGTNWFRYASGSVNTSLSFVTGNNLQHQGVFTLTDSALSPLPVSLTYFKGKAIDNNVILNWQTASEINNAGFFVERSLDGLNFYEIGFINGKGTTNQTTNYNFTDINAFDNGNILYYRLRQVDFDGNYEYSQIITVNNNKTESFIACAFPNPFKESTTLLFDANEGDAIININDVSGQLVKTFYTKTIEGLNTVELNELHGLLQGLYIVTIHTNAEKHVLKLIKQ